MTMVMYVPASVTQSTVEEWRRALDDLPCLDFRLGAGSVVPHDCDAQVIKFHLVHDRYGGTPEVGKSQVLTNTRGDGSPALIVATPPFASGPEVTDPVELEGRTHFTFSHCLDEISRLNSIRPGAIARVLIHIEGLGLEEIGREPSIIGPRRALTQRTEHDSENLVPRPA
ncbi:hypothetical protein [Kutzneria sp. NPDC052558]|uniref:hypothetical protein n=1 Tax=Kutzneria sp. NPDC052558 TaxID=3364121 RepID=UPI0037CA377F